MAEIEIGILSRQCLNRRIDSRNLLRSEVDARQQARNALERTIEWTFTRQDADHNLALHYGFQCVQGRRDVGDLHEQAAPSIDEAVLRPTLRRA